MTFKPIAAYILGANSVIKYIRGYINQTQRIINIDTKLLDMLWPFRINTAIYIHNRLINPKIGKTLIIS